MIKPVAFLTTIATVGALILATGPRITRAADAAVTALDQSILRNIVLVPSVTSDTPGWIAIHATSEGAPVIGTAYVPAGKTANVTVKIDTSKATPELIAMLHADDGQAGIYEFDGKNGLDLPVKVNDQLVAPKFKVIGAAVANQFVTDEVTVGTIIAQADSFIVIHATSAGNPPIGFAPIKAGVNREIKVKVDASKVTPRLTAMIHDDSGTVGKYEFDGKNGLDLPTNIAPQGTDPALGGSIINAPFWSVEHVEAGDQLVTGDEITITSVLAKAKGFIVIHATSEGNPGIGIAPIEAGYTANVKVKVDVTKLTPVVLAMLHVDDGAVGKYEFDGKNGLDGPVKDAEGQIIAPPLMTTDSVRVTDGLLEPTSSRGFVVVDNVTAEANGFIVIHATSEGNPGIGVQFVPAGTTGRVIVMVDAAKLTPKVLAMLHIDDGALGKYEFDGKNGLDAPVKDAAGKVVAPVIELK